MLYNRLSAWGSSLLLTFLLSAPVVGQSPQGTITGTVSDVQGARVPEATVTAVQIDTNQKFNAVSSTDGVYAIPSLPVGKYEVMVTAPGFATFKQSNVTLEVGQRLRLDAALQVGDLNNTVTVTTEISRVQTEASSLGTTVERQRIQNLPLNGRHVFNLVKLIPGVQPRFKGSDGFAEVDNQNFSQISFNGGSVYSNQVFLDGGANTVPVHNEISVVPMVDSVEEFKVQTNSLSAEFGQTSGGVISIVTRSGTNQFHGSLYEFFRNDALDARNAFLTERDPITGRTKPILRYNQYGGTLGGPIFLPALFNGKDKTFFFAGYERWNFRTANINRATVPTLREREGDFSNTRDGQGRLITIYDSATTRPNPNGSGFVRDPFEGNIIPRERMDPLSLRLLEYLPLPNVAPNNPFTNANNYLTLVGFPIDQGQLSARIDHNFSDKDKIFGRYTRTKNTRMNRAWNNGLADTDARDDQRDNHNLVISETHVFSTALVNDFRASATRQDLVFQHPSFDLGLPAQLGFPAILPQDAFPPIVIGGVLPFGSGRGGFAGGYRKHHTIQVSDSLTWVKGRHTFKIGTDQRWNRLNFVNRLNPSGSFNFSASLTNNPQAPAGTGVGFATFLLGEVSGGSQSIRPFFAFHSASNGSYFQDDWKIARRLTLNLGLRYDYATGPVERWNRSSNFDPFVTNPQTSMPGALLYAGATKDRHFTIPPKKNFGPRIGFAWDVNGNGRLAVRAGYGLIYNAIESGDTVGDNPNSLGFSVDTPFIAPGGGPFKAFQFSAGPPNLLQPQGVESGPSAFRGQVVRFQELRAPTPYVQQWNLTIQRELFGKFVLAATYAGNRGVHQFGGNYDLNQLDPHFFSLGLSLQDQVTNPYFGKISTGLLSGPRVARSQLLRPFPDYQGIGILANHGASSTYHSFQFTAERRYSNGLSALVSYTNAKLIDDSFSIAGGGGGSGEFRIGRLNRAQDRAIDEEDISQRLVVSAVYELPFGHGRRFLKDGFLSRIIGGWQLNTITTLQTGRPLKVRGANNFTGINWPDTVCNPTLEDPGINAWFNTGCFRNPPNFVIGNVPRTLPSTRGPGYKDVALSLFRIQKISEKFNLEFRAEAFNAFNFVNHGDPNTSFTPNAQGVNTNPNFGKITSSLPARRIQFGVRLSF
jgi:Carboxypeptidase regulatory-like domain